MNLEDIEQLAASARLDMSKEEMASLAADFDSILTYVSQVQEVADGQDTETEYYISNIMRDDIVTNSSGEQSATILDEAPHTQDGFLKVKQIL